MKENKKKVCFVNGANPNFDGGISLYQRNLIKYLESKNKNLAITWIYKSDKNNNSVKGGVSYVGLNSGKIPFVEDFRFNKKVKRYLDKNYFDIINSHAIWGYWMKNYNKKGNQKIINTYHGAAFPYYKVQLKRFGIIKRILFSSLLLYSYLIEKSPIKKADKIICVSEKVKKQIGESYWKRKNIFVIRTGVNLSDFKQRDKNKAKKELNLEKDKNYGLYVGRGGYWIKGLDRAIRISEEIYKTDKSFRLIVIGSDKHKVGNLLAREFVVYLKQISREKIPYYYNAADFLFALSRYEGGAPTLVVSEAMASGCLVVCSKDSVQETIYNGENGLVLEKFNNESALKILNLLKNKKTKEEMIKNSIKTIKNVSIENWGKEYLNVILNKN